MQNKVPATSSGKRFMLPCSIISHVSNRQSWHHPLRTTLTVHRIYCSQEPREYFIDRLVQGIADVVKGLGHDSCILVGHDWCALLSVACCLYSC